MTEAGRERQAPPLALHILIAVAVVLVLVLVGRQLRDLIGPFIGWARNLGFWAPVTFTLGYAVATVAFVPGSVLTLAAGAIFGLLRGSVIVFIGATLGASAAFLIARTLARSAVEKRLAGNDRFAAIDRAIGREGRKIVFLLRLSPAFPFVALNYALGLTRVSFLDYLLACSGMIPGTILYVYYGKLAGDVVAAGGPIERGWEYFALLTAGLIATLAATAVITRSARRALAQELRA